MATHVTIHASADLQKRQSFSGTVGRWHEENESRHVDRVGHVVAQKAPPSRGGDLGTHGMHRPTVAWLILMPSLSSSPWMRGAPHNGLALLIRRIKARISVPILGRPGRRDRHRQKSRKPLRCHWITVVGLTKTIASMTCGQIRYSHTHRSRSSDESCGRPRCCRRRTFA